MLYCARTHLKKGSSWAPENMRELVVAGHTNVDVMPVIVNTRARAGGGGGG